MRAASHTIHQLTPRCCRRPGPGRWSSKTSLHADHIP